MPPINAVPPRPIPPPPDMGQLDERGLPPMSIEEYQAQFGNGATIPPPPGTPAPPNGAISLPPIPPEKKQSFLEKLAPYLPTIFGAGVGLLSKGGSPGQAFGAGMVRGSTDELLMQRHQKRQAELEQEQNLIKNVNKRMESARRIADPKVFDQADPRHVAAKQVIERYAQMLLDGKLTEKEASNLSASLDKIGNMEQMLDEAEQNLAIKKAEEVARINQRIKREGQVQTEFGMMDPEDVARHRATLSGQAASESRFNRSQENMFARQQRMFDDLRERPWNIPQGTQQELSAFVNNYTNLHTLDQALKRTPVQGPVLGRITLGQADKLGGMGLSPDTIDVVNRLKRAVAEQAFEKGGKVLTPTELEVYSTSYVPAMTDTVQQAAVKAKNALQFLKNAYASKMAVMPERQRQQLPGSLEEAVTSSIRYGGTGVGDTDIPAPPGGAGTSNPNKRRTKSGVEYTVE